MNSDVRFGPAFVWDNPVGENKSPLNPKEKHLAMNGTKKLLIGLVTVAGMPAFADTETTDTSSGESRLETLFKAHALEPGSIGGVKVTTEKRNVAPNGFWKRHLDKIGVGGSLFAALCCLGFPALVSILSAIGLGFLINDDILRPLMIVFFAGRNFGARPWHASRQPMGTDRRNPERGDVVCVHPRLIQRGDSRTRPCRPRDCQPVECISATATAEETTKMNLRHAGKNYETVAL
jgi:MerC mercury resistance protein